VIGTREDVTGFALAGVEGVVCTTAEEASRAIERAGEDVLVILSPDLSSCRLPTANCPLMIVLP
jgi:vacuolar-type H+-ATPase subunit F/Vma7